MRVVRFHELGGPEVLRLEEAAPGVPGAGEALVRIRVIGLNRAEASFRAGRYIEQARELPAGLGYEAAGVIEQVGDGESGFAVGDRVSILPTFSMNDYQVYAEQAVVPVSALVKLAAEVSLEQGAAVWMPYLTAYGALVDIAGIGKGDTVLIPAASSSVGLAAIRIAGRLGAVPIAVTRTAAKKAALEEAGAAAVVVTDEQDLATEVLRLTEGAGATVVFDPVAGPGFNDLAQLTARGGTLFLYGSLSNQPTPFPRAAIGRGINIRGYVVFEITAHPVRKARALEFVTAGLAEGWLDPAIDRSFPLDEIVTAHEYLESNKHIGKILVTVD
ncbi:zinc-dependent alcohol dehydrogenase family protein [Kitasatospora viridis]|uniref:NADPH:quinone reductase-like Zn-dependent oxidoreductase n=1 Tax=Kitasatospora viridis TaxID=281105 RepID=A0A561UPS9_9ACTN|nr:zinc-dependent alcohol dehydrogenase family protein [Kitasatospora viridis]TWG01376.1 NADPH:quinone reductase-like Zn-dependent oxidoreductase [Kitasatospora viridis]